MRTYVKLSKQSIKKFRWNIYIKYLGNNKNRDYKTNKIKK